MSFYVRDGDRYVSTPWTRGPWSLDSQHGGPPAALLGHAIEQLPSDVPMRVSRFTIEILRPIPLAALSLRSSIVRDGRRIQLCEAALLNGDDPVAIARAWRIRESETDIASLHTHKSELRAPLSCPELEFPPEPKESYMHGVEWRIAEGTPFNGPSTVWFRMRIPLIDDEQPTPLERVLIAADCGNGISAVLPMTMLFINVDLTVHVVRAPQGEWVALQSETLITPDGIGQANSTLWDEETQLGTSAQSLYVGAR